MHWIVNSNFYKEAGYLKLMETLERLGLSSQVVKTVPHTDRLICEDYDTSRATVDVDQIPEPEIDASKPIIIMGSYTLANIAAKRGWTPGAFVDNLDYASIQAGWGVENLLNSDNQVSKIRDLTLTEDTFVRPVADSKQFSGKVFEPEEFNKWKDVLLKMTKEDMMDADTLVVTASPKQIYTETRCFVVNDEIVTVSGYKRGKHVIYTEGADSEVIIFAKSCATKWRPNPAFVLDIAQTPDGCKIVEANCINAAGYYAANVMKLVCALEDAWQ